MILTIVAGARPNFIKIAPIIKAIRNSNSSDSFHFRLVHTGQHYDKKMSGDFFTELGIPDPDVNLASGGGTQAEQTAAIMVNFEKELLCNPTDGVLVVGDVTSTMACTIVAKKLCIPVFHVEAGIRSGDMTMPEEINRIVTDSICDHFFTTSINASETLISNGIDQKRVHFVGNTMIDTLYQNLNKLIKPDFWDEFQLEPKSYYLLTLHRPSNVDDCDKLVDLLWSILNQAGNTPIIFPVHPRTRQILDKLDFKDERLLDIQPLSYLRFIYLVKHAKGIITDSGGITEEATVLGVPCITLRDSTERPETVTVGTNELIGTDPDNLFQYMHRLNYGQWKKGSIPELWDGHTSERIVNKLVEIFQVEGSFKFAYDKVY